MRDLEKGERFGFKKTFCGRLERKDQVNWLDVCEEKIWRVGNKEVGRS